MVNALCRWVIVGLLLTGFGAQAQTDVRDVVKPDPNLSGHVITHKKSQWIPVPWSELTGWADDALHEAWNAWLKSCERTGTALFSWCPQVRRLSITTSDAQRAWFELNFQPYRVTSLNNKDEKRSEGLLTSYFEPLLEARRQAGTGFSTPLYRSPKGVDGRKVWYSREEMDTLPQAKTALEGHAIAYVADPVDALLLQIQGSGRLQITEPDGTVKMVRLAYATTNGQAYKSVGRWLLDQGLIKDATWPGISAWVKNNPERVSEMLWSNPRVVFFREEALKDMDLGSGPKGAQGVALTPGRSIAVDPGSIPYGAPVWLESVGSSVQLRKLVFAQDTGSAIVGAVRADYFAGWGPEAGALAGRLKQPLQLWVLWPKSAESAR